MDTNSLEFKAALRDHAKSLGVDPDAEPHLMALVEEALLVETPEGWEQGETEDGTLYYFNTTTEESIWEHPLDAHYRELIQAKKQEQEVSAVSTSSSSRTSSGVKAVVLEAKLPVKDEPVKPLTTTTSAITSVKVYSFDEDSDDDNASATSSKAVTTSKANDSSSTSRISSLFPQPAPSFSATSAAMNVAKKDALGTSSSSSLGATSSSKGASGLGGGGFGRDRSWLLDGDDDEVEIPTLGKATTIPVTAPAPSSFDSTTSRIESFGSKSDESAFEARPSSSFATGIMSRGATSASAATGGASSLSFTSRMYGASGTSPAIAANTASSLASGSLTLMDTAGSGSTSLSGTSTSPKAGSPRRGGIGSSIKSQFFQEMTTSSSASPSSASATLSGPTTSLPADVAKIQQLEKRISELTKQNEQLTSDHDKTKQQLDQALLDAKESNYLKMKANESKAKLAEKDAKLQKLTNDHAATLTKLQQEIQSLKGENDRLAKNQQQQQASSSIQEVLEMRQSVVAVQAEKAALQKELSDLEQKLRDAQQNTIKQQQLAQEHAEKLTRLEATLERERHEHSSEVGDLRDTLEQRRRDHELELQQFRSQLDTVKTEMSDKERRTESLGALQDTLDRQSKFLKEVEEKNKELQAKLATVEEREAVALKDVKRHEQECSDVSKRLSTAQGELEAKEKQIRALNEKVRTQVEQMASFEGKSSEWTRQEGEFKREKAAMDRERRDLAHELQDKTEELQKLHTQTRKLQDEHLNATSRLQMEIQEFQNQLKALKVQELIPLEKQGEQLRRDNERLSERLALQDKEHRQTVHELATASNAIHQLQVEIEAWKRKEQQQKAQKDMVISVKSSLEKHAADLEAEHSSYKNQKRLEVEKLTFRMRELESQLAQKDYEILRVEERFTKAEAWRLKEARRVEERDSQLLGVKEELAQLKNRNVEAENSVVIQELRRDREQLQHKIAQLSQELEDEKAARLVSGQKFHDELNMMQKGLEWQLPQLAAACVSRSSEEWVRKCHQVVKALRDDFNMKALTERNELLTKIKNSEDARDHVEQKYKNMASECDFLRKEVHRVEDNNKVLLDQLHTIRVYMTSQRSMPGSMMNNGFPSPPPQASWAQYGANTPGSAPPGVPSPPQPPPPTPGFGVPFTDFSTINHLNTQLGILHAQFQQLFDATERPRPPGVSIPKSSFQYQHHSQQFSPSDRFEIPVSPPSAKQHHVRSADHSSSELDQTMDVLLDQTLESTTNNGVVVGRAKDLEREKEQLISTLEAIGLAAPSQLLATTSPALATSLVLDEPLAGGAGTAWYQKDYWRTKYQL